MPKDQQSPLNQGRTQPQAIAALDLGTNNCRLLIARPTTPEERAVSSEPFRVIDSFSRITRLGEGLAATGKLSEGAMARTVEALKICASKTKRRGVSAARYVATEACRRASNGEAFISKVKKATGMDLEPIAAEEEARLALMGCAPLLKEGKSHALVFDVGGGSTEVIWAALDDTGRPKSVESMVSLPMGVVTVSEEAGGHVTDENYDHVVQRMAEALAPFAATPGLSDLVSKGHIQMLGTSGTITTVAGAALGLRRYDRSKVDGLTLQFSDVEGASARLIAMTSEERAAHPCIGKGRADLVVAGCAILDAIQGLWPVGRLTVADRGLREGILTELAGQ